MAHFDTEYQRLEASYSDSPPGEENLLMHVPEGAKCNACTCKAQKYHTCIHVLTSFALIVITNLTPILISNQRLQLNGTT